jgi:hypothetical protein
MIRGLTVLAIADGALLAWGGAGGVAPGLATGVALAGHGALTIAALVLRLRDRVTAPVAAALAVPLGPVALLAILSLDRLLDRSLRIARSGPPIDRDGDGDGDGDEAVAGRTGLAAVRMLDGRVHHAEAAALGSLVTIMRHGDVGARRRALETAVRSFRPALSPLIALALTDRDQTIRALAAAAAARVGQNLALARAGLEARSGAEDDPGATATLIALLADHARSDVLLSDAQRAHLRDDAVALLASADPATMPGGVDVRDGLLIEAFWAAGDYVAIDRLAAAAVARGGGSVPETAAWWHRGAAA